MNYIISARALFYYILSSCWNALTLNAVFFSKSMVGTPNHGSITQLHYIVYRQILFLLTMKAVVFEI